MTDPEVTGPEVVDGWPTYRADLGLKVRDLWIGNRSEGTWARVVNNNPAAPTHDDDE